MQTLSVTSEIINIPLLPLPELDYKGGVATRETECAESPLPSARRADPMTRLLRSVLRWSLLAGCGLLVGSCVDQEDTFTQGRIETTCGNAIPVCDTRAACVVGDDSFVTGAFPGGLKTIVRTDDEDNRLLVRFLLDDLTSPGTELLVRASEPGCGAFDERQLQDVDLFDRAGNDRILAFELELDGAGDHLLEIFSDMAADYTMTVTVESND